MNQFVINLISQLGTDHMIVKRLYQLKTWHIVTFCICYMQCAYKILYYMKLIQIETGIILAMDFIDYREAAKTTFFLAF